MRSERGSVTAEFAVALPAVVLLLGLLLAGLSAGALGVRVQDAAGLAALAFARGEPAGVARASAQALLPGAELTRSDRSGLVCAAVSARAPGMLSGLVVRAESCALGQG
jgi:hypothetical protein